MFAITIWLAWLDGEAQCHEINRRMWIRHDKIMDELNWNGMEGIDYENDKYSLEENVLNGRLEIWSR